MMDGSGEVGGWMDGQMEVDDRWVGGWTAGWVD